jgi:hypothetical protein
MLEKDPGTLDAVGGLEGMHESCSAEKVLLVDDHSRIRHECLYHIHMPTASRTHEGSLTSRKRLIDIDIRVSQQELHGVQLPVSTRKNKRTPLVDVSVSLDKKFHHFVIITTPSDS